MKTRWNEKTSMEKVMRMIRTLLLVVVIVLIIFRFFGVVNSGIKYAVPLLGIEKCISAFQQWKEDRDLASLDILLAIITFTVTFIIWFAI